VRTAGRGLVVWIVSALALLMGGCASSSSAPTQPRGQDVNAHDPLGATVLMQQGQMLVAEGRIADGMAKYQAVVKMQPKNPTIHNLIGQAELWRGDAAKAVDSFNRALALAPTYSDARNNRGVAYAQLGQYAMAESDYLAVLADTTYANRAGVYLNLGVLYFGRGNLGAAEENLRRAATASGPVDAYFLLGQVEEKLGKPALAESALREAATRAPERPDIALALGRLLEGQGRTDEARKIYVRILEVAPNSPEAAQVRPKVSR